MVAEDVATDVAQDVLTFLKKKVLIDEQVSLAAIIEEEIPSLEATNEEGVFEEEQAQDQSSGSS